MAVQPGQPECLVGSPEGERTVSRCREEGAVQKGAYRSGNPSGLASDLQTRRIEGLCEERAVAHEQQMAPFALAVRHVRRAEARCEDARRRGRLWRRVERVDVDAGVLGRGSGHAQVEEPPTVGEKPRKQMRRLLSRRIRLRHDGRLAARRRTADDATLRASDHDDAVLVPRAADGEPRARCRRSVDRPQSRRPSSVVRLASKATNRLSGDQNIGGTMPPSATSVPGSGRASLASRLRTQRRRTPSAPEPAKTR